MFFQVGNEPARLMDRVCVIEARQRKVDYWYSQALYLRSQNASSAQRRDVHLIVATLVQQRRHLDHLTFGPPLEEAMNDL